jgi:hypothetical protein
MRGKKLFWSIFACTASVVFLSGVSFADSAEVLPKGISNLSIASQFYFPVDTEFDSDGNKEKIYADYTGLSILDLFGLDLGTTVIDFERNYLLTGISYQYGLSDKISIGLNIPLWKQETDLKEAKVDTSTGDATTLIGIGCTGVPGADDDCATQVVLAQLEALFGYETFDSWSDSGLSDIAAGLRYQYFKNDDWRLAFTGVITFPTGEVDDPDNLLDLDFGTGSHILGFHFNQDYMGIESLLLNATLRYDMVLPAKVTLRVPDDVDEVFTNNKEKVDRDIGDAIEIELSGNYSLSDTWSTGLLYLYGIGMKDEVSGDMGFAYESLEDETDYIEQVYVVSISYSTLQLFMDKKFSIPLTASLSYRDRFAGKNGNNSQYLALGLSLYF